MIHQKAHPLAGKMAKICDDATVIGGREIQIEDWWDRVAGASWMFSTNNPACLNYAVRSSVKPLPTDDLVVYGKIDGFGYLVHASELCPDPCDPKAAEQQERKGAMK